VQTANITLAIGGDKGNTIPKFGVTAAEIAVLRLIHGDEAVFDVDPQPDIQRNNRSELGRLIEVYGKMQDGKEIVVSTLFPGAAARVFDRLDELGIPEEFYKAMTRAAPAAVKAVLADGAVLPPAPEPDDEDDGIGEMPDAGAYAPPATQQDTLFT
jgi:hypothetical protein